MKRRWCLVVMVVFLTGVAHANMLTDPGFESGGGAWTTNGGVSFESWGARSGQTGFCFQGWTAGTPGSLQQDVAAATGTYTFAAWIKMEPDFAPMQCQLRMDWLDAGGANVKARTSYTFTGLARDGGWHHVSVTGTCTNQNLATLRVAVYSSWTPASGSCSMLVDDLDVYSGGYLPVAALDNAGFESGQGSGWQGAQWHSSPDAYGNGRWDWALRSGSWGAAFRGDDTNHEAYSTTISQNLTPGTGTYAFGVWMLRPSTNMLMTNAALRIEWYDASRSNRVQADSITNFVPPPDNTWHFYSVSGACGDGSLAEVRATILGQWLLKTNDGAGRSALIDDARFVRGAAAVRTDWAYHNATGVVHASMEQVPGTNVGAFLQADYVAHSNTIYILGDHPSVAQHAGDTGRVFIRTAWYYDGPPASNWVIEINPMEKIGSVELGAGAFHGRPASGTATVDVYRFSGPLPRTPGGDPCTNAATVYYAPFLAAVNVDGETTAVKYLVGSGGVSTNELGQRFNEDFSGDYAFTYAPPTLGPSLLNGDFEAGSGTAVSNWSGWGDWGRETFAAREGTNGGIFRTWTGGSFGLWQDAACTGDLHTFSIWMRQQPGVTSFGTIVRMEWYNSLNHLMHTDSRTWETPSDDLWHRVYVTGACTNSGAGYVRCLVIMDTWVGPSATFFDEARLEPGAFAGSATLENGGFETGQGPDFRGTGWDGIPNTPVPATERADWAWRSGAQGAVFRGYVTNVPQFEGTISRPVHAATGTYTFAVWLARETNALMTNVALGIRWYGTNLVPLEADTLTNITAEVPNDGVWREYHLTAACTNPALFEMRPMVFAQWDRNLAQTEYRSMKMDDARLWTGGYVEPLVTDWAYHSGGAMEPTNEAVPGSYGAFLQVNYASTTTTFFALANAPSVAGRPDETGSVGIRISWFNTNLSAFVHATSAMSRVGSVALTPSSSFHGLPVAGTKTVDVWRYDWTQPLDPLGAPRQEDIYVYYAFYIRAEHDGTPTGAKWLVDRNGQMTNSYPVDPQLLDDDYLDKDYVYLNSRFVPAPADTDGDGMPDDWEDAHGLLRNDPTDATSDSDFDGRTALQEYIADTDPEDEFSFFPNEITNVTGRLVLQFVVGPPTTNSRRYEVWLCTNLVGAQSWTPCGVSQPGRADGGSLTLSVTSTPPRATYATGVRLP